jgi:hypothetical protein
MVYPALVRDKLGQPSLSQMIPNFVISFLGRHVGDKLDLKENQEMPTKPWYQSKGVWTAAIAGVLGLYQAVSAIHPLPAIPPFVFTLLSAMGLYSLRTADTKIT